jgi:2TM family of unknown function (DUF5676)
LLNKSNNIRLNIDYQIAKKNKSEIMNPINIKKFGLAFGITGAGLYFGCILIMFLAGTEGTIKVFNCLLHGLDISMIIRMNIPLWETGLGLVLTFALWWLIGTCVALIYNKSMNTNG